MRWLASVLGAGLLVGLLGLGSAADAQVFKPKGKKADAGEKRATKASAKKPKAGKKKSTKKKSTAAERARPADLTPEPSSKSEDSDFVKITDDDEIE